MTTSRYLGFAQWRAVVHWPDGESFELETCGADEAAVEKYCRDIWGLSITVEVIPKETHA